MSGGATPLYDAFADAYDLMVDWPRRLERETPFFARLFETHGVHRVLDAACGTGHHARLFASWGLEVVGADASAAMIERARAEAGREGEGGRTTWVQVDLLRLARAVEGPFDVVICIGNSLPHLRSAAEVHETLKGFHSLLRPGGVLVIQNRDPARLYAGRGLLLGPSARTVGDTEYVFVRLYDVREQAMRLHILTLIREKGAWKAGVESTDLIPLFADELASMSESAGFAIGGMYGGYDEVSYAPADSDDLLLVAVSGSA